MDKTVLFNKVSDFISKENYSLISKEYKNNKTKLDLKCEKGHLFEMRFNDFQQGHRCPVCKKVKKLNYEYVKEFIEKENYQLISTEYKNNYTKLKVRCDKEHEYEVNFNNFQRGYRCPICDGNQKLTYNFVKNFIKKEGYDLVSEEYKNSSSKLEFKCDKNHNFEMSFNNFHQGQRCPICNLSNVTSKGEKEVFEYVRSIYSGIIIENDRSVIFNPLTNRYLELDMYLPEIRFAIEYNGEYYHSLPVQTVNDKIKKEQCKNLDINLLIINEKEWRNNKENCINSIRKFIYEN